MPDPTEAKDVAFNAKDVLGHPTAPKAWFDAARKETRHWLIPGLGEADDPWCGYPLIDALSNPGKNATVKEGIERAAELADDVVLSVWKVAQPEIERLSKELQEARKLEALVREYISERDAPVQDLGYRANLLSRIRSVLSPEKDSETEVSRERETR